MINISSKIKLKKAIQKIVKEQVDDSRFFPPTTDLNKTIDEIGLTIDNIMTGFDDLKRLFAELGSLKGELNHQAQEDSVIFSPSVNSRELLRKTLDELGLDSSLIEILGLEALEEISIAYEEGYFSL